MSGKKSKIKKTKQKKITPPASSVKRSQPKRAGGLKNFVKQKLANIKTRGQRFMTRRPHRSFRLTRRRDYKRSLEIPGYFAFTLDVTQILWRNKSLFFCLILVFFVLVILFGLMGQQNIYDQMRLLLDETAPEAIFDGPTGEISKAGVILLTAVTNGLSGQPDNGQAIIAGLLSLYLWLTTIWLMRKIVAGKKPILRDALYMSGAPILPTMLLWLVLLLQMVPGALAILVASAGWQSGLIEPGVFSMLVSIALFLIAILSLYWMVSTFVALVLITLPGAYPMKAIAIAGDLVVGRRLRFMYRILWMILVVVSWWVVIMIPIILFDGWIKSVFEQVKWLPIVPVSMLLMMIITAAWVTAYIYLLYRKLVDDGSAPA